MESRLSDFIQFKAVDFSAAPRSGEKDDRNDIWCKLYEEGKTATDIGAMYGVSRERVYQILRKANLIERKWQRRRLASELIETDRLEIKAAKEEIDRQLIELVRGGLSIASAAGQLNLTVPHAMNVCQKHGVVSLHGRWRDFSGRRNRLTEIVESGYSLNIALLTVSAEEGRQVTYNWVHRNCQELLAKNRRPANSVIPQPPEKPPATPQIQQHAIRQVYPEIDWDEARQRRLCELWFKGSSAQQVADIFGDCTRNAVIGQIRRLRVAGKLLSPDLKVSRQPEVSK